MESISKRMTDRSSVSKEYMQEKNDQVEQKRTISGIIVIYGMGERCTFALEVSNLYQKKDKWKEK